MRTIVVTAVAALAMMMTVLSPTSYDVTQTSPLATPTQTSPLPTPTISPIPGGTTVVSVVGFDARGNGWLDSIIGRIREIVWSVFQ